MPSVLSVTETFQARSMKAATDRTRDYTRTFDVIVDERTISPDMILFAIGLPRRWDVYVSAAGTVDLYSICKEIEVKQDTLDPFTWRVTARYSNKVNRPDVNQVENPLLRPAEIEYDTEGVPRPAWFDRDGEPVQNSAYERFDPPLEYEEPRLLIRITKNYATYDALGYLRFHNTVNSQPWFGLPKGRVWCRRIKGRRQFESGIYYWPTSFEFLIRVHLDEQEGDISDPVKSENAWAERVLDRGYMELNGDGDPVHMRDLRTGQPVGTPQLLNGVGGRLPIGDDPEFLTFHLKREANFNLLPLF